MASFLSLFFRKKAKLENEVFIRTRAPISCLTGKDKFGFEQKMANNHVWMETGNGQPIIFCHGLFGSFRNFASIGQALSNRYRVIVPCMPMYDAPLRNCTVEKLAIYLDEFINDLKLEQVILAGNSMGGGIILHYTICHPENVSILMLFSSSGLSFVPMRGGVLRVNDYNYVKSLMSDIFYRLPDLIDDNDFLEIYNVVQDKSILLRCFSLTRSTKKLFSHEQLKALKHPALIIWGENDMVIPPEIALQFQECLKNSELHYLSECGHCPTYEKPEQCLALIETFLLNTTF